MQPASLVGHVVDFRRLTVGSEPIALARLLGVLLCNTPQTESAGILFFVRISDWNADERAFGVYPLLLPASTDPALSLTIHNAAAGSLCLRIGLVCWFPGMPSGCHVRDLHVPAILGQTAA